MGAWATGSFGNDRAGDWAVELRDQEDLSFVEQTLDDLLAIGDDYLDSCEASAGLAACEVIARLKGRWGVRDGDSRNADEWVEAHPQRPPKNLVAKAVAVIDRVLSEPSELLALWADSDDFAEWQRAVADLRSRVLG